VLTLGPARPGLLLAATAALCLATPPAAAEPRVLLFTKTAGFRHGSIPDGIALVQALGAAHGFTLDATEDSTAFSAANLAQYAAVLWLSTTGDVLDAAQEAAFEGYIRAGGAFIGVHSAGSTERDWPWYGGLLGGDAWLLNHPSVQTATLDVVDPTHPSTEALPASFSLLDEWYNFEADPTPVVNVLVTVDETTYSGGSMGPDHPISWFHLYDGGRSWYTALGHTSETYASSEFADHLLGGILWATAPDPEPVPSVPISGAALLALLLARAGRRSLRRPLGEGRRSGFDVGPATPNERSLAGSVV
jgi:type 1 glutamine amidotransferase